jgi:hypothetical protein
MKDQRAMGVRNRLVLDQIAAICRPSSARLSIPLVREVRRVHRSSPPVARINFINRKERVHHRKVNRKPRSPSRVNLKQVNNTRASNTRASKTRVSNARVSNARVSPTKAMGRRRSRDKEGTAPAAKAKGAIQGKEWVKDRSHRDNRRRRVPLLGLSALVGQTARRRIKHTLACSAEQRLAARQVVKAQRGRCDRW